MPHLGIDRVSSFFQQRRAARQPNLVTSGRPGDQGTLASLSATPVPEPAPIGPSTLFVQSFQSGSIVPSRSNPNRLSVTLEHGLGQTIAFADRPGRQVAARPTEEILATLGFPADNPPNAALIVDGEDEGGTISVVELFEPAYDAESATLTYEMAVLSSWEHSADFGFDAVATDAELPAAFGTAHLFIDDCADHDIVCADQMGAEIGRIDNSQFGGWCYAFDSNTCVPCTSVYDSSYVNVVVEWVQTCNNVFDACEGLCKPQAPGFAY